MPFTLSYAFPTNGNVDRKEVFALTPQQARGFTLIELLIVIAIIAVLAVAVILALNPTELLRRSRDATRLSDFKTLNTALGIYNVDVGGSLGNASIIYISIPDSTATSTAGTDCSALGLPALPAGYQYHCAGPSTYKSVDGTGWIPINFGLIASGRPIGTLPVDPINTSSSRSYYAYIPGGSWELTTVFESARYKLGGVADKISTDGGQYPDLYETGTNLTLLPIDYGDSALVGYWRFDEGNGTVAYDASGGNSTGTLTNGPTWQTSDSCILGTCLSFDGSNDRVVIWDIDDTEGINTITVSAWVKLNDTTSYKDIVSKQGSGGGSWYYELQNNVNRFCAATLTASCVTGSTLTTGRWYFLTAVYNGSNMQVYLNGVSDGSPFIKSGNITAGTSKVTIGSSDQGNYLVNGLIDDVRIYNRALSAAEILAIYNATK